MSSPADLLSLSDDELEAVMAAAVPLAPRSRDVFLREVAAELRRYQDIGPGLVGRVCRELQRKHFDPPNLDGHREPNAYGRKVAS
jgi:hypothetical protein